MCFSVRRRHVCPGEKRRILRKSAFCAGTLTERRILRSRRDGKAHSEAHRLGRVRLSVRSSSNRDLRTLAQPAPQAGGWLLERVCPVEAFSIVPRSLAGGCPTPPGRRDVTEKRILLPVPHGKAHSAPGASRKSAFCLRRLTEKRSLACLGITHRAFPRLLKPQNVSFRNSRLDCRRHDDAPRHHLDIVSKLTRRGRRGDAWHGVARGQGAAHVNDGLTESCPILRK